MILLPQIIHNIKSPNTTEFDKDFLIYYIASGYLLLFYYRGISDNIINLEPFFWKVLIGIFILLLTLVIIYFQDLYGAYFIIPDILSNQHNYFISYKNYCEKLGLDGKKKLNESDDSIETNETNSFMSSNNTDVTYNKCIICLDGLENFDNEKRSAVKNKNFKRILKKIRKDCLMYTPCGHAFHPGCLMKWMEIKMECPYCRAILPHLK